MDTCTPYSSVQTASLDRRAPVLVVCGNPEISPIERQLDCAGWRAATVTLRGLRDRMAMQANAMCLLVETDQLLDEDWETEIGEVADSRLPIMLSGPATAIDRMAAFADRQPSEILVDPTAVDLAMALELVRPSNVGCRVNEVSAEPSAARLRQLSDEVGRIAATLARLSTSPTSASVERPPTAGSGPAAAVSGETVRAVIRARRLRSRFFDPALFADPAWDMLLDLFQAEIAQHRVPVSSLCIAASVPPTTALRWIKTMTDSGLFRRRADPHDGRRIFVELAPEASDAMRRYFTQAGSLGAA